MKDTEVVFHLRYSRAQQVFLIGSFNNWSTTATPMRQIEPDRWEASILLGTGEHRYCYFAIDKSWFVPGSDLSISPTAVINAGSMVRVPGGQRILAEQSLN